MSVRIVGWLIIGATFLSTVVFAARPAASWQFASMSLLLLTGMWFFVLLAFDAKNWRKRGPGLLLYLLATIATFPAASYSGVLIRDTIFSRNIERWNEAARWVEKQGLPNRGAMIQLPEQYADLAYRVHYNETSACGRTIDFFWGSGFPVRHTVRRYATNPNWTEAKECRAGWRGGRLLSPSWYELSG